MKLFMKRTRGSVTVLVTLILVPTVFFTGFLVDLARLKLYGNQAVMTADTYGETVLSLYDNLLKELYGLFAVTQDEDTLEKLDKLQGYIKSSFDPSENTISWEYLQTLLGKTSYDGFMPYQSASITLSHEVVKDANLRNEEIFGTQIGDFMKFRIAQQMLGDGADLMDAISQIQNMEDNAKAIDKKLEMDEKAEEIYEAAQEFYTILKDFVRYPDYITGINTAYFGCAAVFSEIINSDSYQIYRAYETCDKDAMNAAVGKRNRIEGDEENEDTEARRDKLEEEFDTAVAGIIVSVQEDPINFDNFNSKLETLKEKAKAVKDKGNELETLKKQMEEMLADGNITEELRAGLQEDLDRMNDLSAQLDDYTGIADFIDSRDKSVNSDYRQQVLDGIERFEEIREAWLDCRDTEEIPANPGSLNENKWTDFREKEAYGQLYESLEKCFGPDGEEEEGKTKKKDAENMLKYAKEGLDKEEQNTSARDIPADFGYGKTYTGSGFNLSKMVKEAAGYFSMNSFSEAANKLILKLYMVEYDFGMFTSRTTNVKAETESGSGREKKAVSLTGYEKSAKINYLYQAELEYILGGSDSSKDNLEAARNKILAFRAIVNFTATYSVKEVNNAIQSISNAASAVNPILGLAVNSALRLAAAGVETAADWEKLKKREEVVLVKTKWKQLTSYDKMKSLLGDRLKDTADSDEEEGEPSGIKMDYDQYLMVMLIFLTTADEVAERTANLVELNINTVQQDIKSNETLSKLEFQMKDAYTAVNAACTVHLDFVVIPKGFAKSVASPEVYDGLVEFEKNSYKFTVTRGY